MADPAALDAQAAPVVAAFSRVALPYDLLTTGSVQRSIFDDPDPSLHLAVYDSGLEAFGSAVVRGTHGWIKLLAVHPRVQRSGIGSSLLDRLETFCREKGAGHVSVGTCAPRYVVPGIDVRATEALCFFEARGYRREGEAVNLNVRLTDLAEPELPCREATGADLSSLLPWVREHYPNWIDELKRAVDLGTCVVHRNLGFACYDVNRDGWFGPIATRPESPTPRVGTATLLSALHRMSARGYEWAEIAWATALPFYVKTVGARISRVFWSYGKDLL